MTQPSDPADPTVIWSGEHRAYWRCDERGNGAGYTKFSSEAGVWPRHIAELMTRHCGPDKAIELRSRAANRKRLLGEDIDIQMDAARQALRQGHIASAAANLRGAVLILEAAIREEAPADV